MSFKVVVVEKDDDGSETRDVIHEIEDRRVIKMRVVTRRGESATVPIEPDEGDLALTFEYMPSGMLHISDVDNLKVGYAPNRTGEEVKAIDEKLQEVRGTTLQSENFTQEAADQAAEAEKANAGTPEEEDRRNRAGGSRELETAPSTEDIQTADSAASDEGTHGSNEPPLAPEDETVEGQAPSEEEFTLSDPEPRPERETEETTKS